MADVEQEVETRFTVADNATKHLTAMHAATSRLSGAFEKATDLVGDLAGVAGAAGLALGLKEVVQGSMEYVGSMQRISELTGDTVEKTVGLAETMGKFGIRGEDAERTLLRMSRRGAALEASMMGAQMHAGGMGAEAQRMGVNMKNGPETALLSISKQVQKGKMGVGEVSRLLGIMPRQALQMMVLLRAGPKALKDSIDEASKKSPINQSTVEQYKQIKILGNQIALAWEQIRVRIGVKLFPLIQHMMEYMKNNLDGWVDKATEFGKTLGGFLDKHGKQIMFIGKLLLANYSITKLTGKGLTQWIPQVLGASNKAAGGLMSAVAMGAKGLFAAGKGGVGLARGAVAGGRGMVDMARFLGGGGPLGMVKGLFTMGGGGLSGMLKGITGLFSGGGLKMLTTAGQALLKLRPIVMTLMRFTLAGAILAGAIAFILTAVHMFKTNAMGVRDIVMGWVEKFRARWAVIVGLFSRVGDLFGGSGAIGHFFQSMVPKVINALGEAVDGILHVIQTIILSISAFAADPRKLMHPTEIAHVFSDAWKEADRLTKEQQRRIAIEDAADKTTAVNTPKERQFAAQVFNNARFDITQKFAENFDPDRIAVAFTNDLANLGERKLQSGFSPLFAVR